MDNPSFTDHVLLFFPWNSLCLSFYYGLQTRDQPRNNGWLVFWSRTMPISVIKQFVQDWTHLLTTSWLVAHCRKNLNKQTCSGRQTLRGHQWYVGRFGFTHPIATRSVGVWAPDFANPFMFGSKYMSYKHCRYLHHMNLSFREIYLICFLAKSQFWLASQFSVGETPHFFCDCCANHQLAATREKFR